MMDTALRQALTILLLVGLLSCTQAGGVRTARSAPASAVPSPSGLEGAGAEASTIRFTPAPADAPPPSAQGTFLDEQHAWVGLVRTSDGGQTWQQLNPVAGSPAILGGMTDRYAKTYFVTPTRGWLAANQGTWQTEDGGLTWRQVFSAAPALPRFGDARHGWLDLSTEPNSTRSYITADGGHTWQPCGAATKGGPSVGEYVYFLNARLGWGITSHTDAGRRKIDGVARTEDGGCDWQQLWLNKANPDETYCDIYFRDERQGWLAGCYVGSLYRTTDGGRQWAEVPLPSERTKPLDVYFTTPVDGWIVASPEGREGTGVYHTADSGKSWHQLTDAELISGSLAGGADGGATSLPPAWRAGKLRQMLYAHRRAGGRHS